MHNVKKVTQDLYWVGVNDRRLELFENAYDIKRGVSYNSYILTDDKTILFDTVDRSASVRFLENVEYALQGKALDYLVVHHVEPDHCSTIKDIIKLYPDINIVCNQKAKEMISNFFEIDDNINYIIIKENDTLTTANHNFVFLSAPMVHWPEVMVSYDTKDKVLFSADAFGTFGALNGNIFADMVEFETEWIDDARRYYTNIVGKYGTQVQSLLKKAEAVDINMICPLHGPIWRENIGYYLDKYLKWSTYTPEKNGVVICYASVYGNTENAVDILASNLDELGIKDIKIYDVSKIPVSYLVSECFKYSTLVFASITYNSGIFTTMENLLSDLKAHNLQNRNVALIENGSWCISSGKQMAQKISEMKNMKLLNDKITVKSSVKNEQKVQLEQLAEAIAQSM